MPALPYKRVLLKVSGEALMGPETHGLHEATLDRVAHDVAGAVELGAHAAVEVGLRVLEGGEQESHGGKASQPRGTYPRR